ncbi:hypothetical protein [Streptomyces scabiei]|uniref:hypothetical protein n=1 Tax=Streptomyces scabiei TaxID=1930 RepID=UPI001B30BDA0|nr:MULTISPECIES: hypothetical protein [Streptomyces]MBP5870823.1 hypothetical protein [Streptomyces sp. LBUM 1485]MBP5913270.1 hypothetical protein [Streptomyces sp. LBUM 1486]MDX2532259.1 hypothetical protein [Streptomyces scabiei]MDX2794565.1 hypothetical protein [Streptomyces scabiei]MDX3822433.1 hypothetical protein [Streptomyces scabiei]
MSALDGRIRHLAREEAAALLGVPSGAPAAADSTSTAEQMQQQITDLHEHLHHAATTISRLEGRIDVLEKAARQPDPQQRPVGRRAARKDAGE